MTDMLDSAKAGADLGPLAAALAKAQSTFPTITRDKTVKVTSKTGKSYSFKYAPLDVVLGAVRAPLAANGLALLQTLDEGSLVTSLMHESGAFVTGRFALPATDDIQALGSAITYLRRYAIQAILGIAAEDDDDGNRAAGNRVEPDVEHGDDGSLIGIAQVGDRNTSDYLLRQTPEGSALGFRLRGDKGGILVEALGPLADQLMAHKDAIVGQRVTVWGAISERGFTPKDKPRVTYQVLAAERVRAAGLPDMPYDATPEPSAAPGPDLAGTEPPEDVPLLSEASSAAMFDELEEIGA